ncbi:hypothetical protein ACIBEA_39305 [Streptomyces sp. NPDC051555]|uniref:hypothetical protein n=1 Tax=Streptomyces sp. NPDC051555 TaxID=3365657 RepID=UPI00379C78C3
MPSNDVTAVALFNAVLDEAAEWAGDDADDHRAIDAITAARTPQQKVQLLRDSALFRSRLGPAVADALIALDPDSYASPTPSAAEREVHAAYDFTYVALATVTLHTTAPTVQLAWAQVESTAGGEIAAPRPGGPEVRVRALTIEPGTVCLDQVDGAPVLYIGSSSRGAPASLLPADVRAAMQNLARYITADRKEADHYAAQNEEGRVGHVFPAAQLLLSYLAAPTG